MGIRMLRDDATSKVRKAIVIIPKLALLMILD